MRPPPPPPARSRTASALEDVANGQRLVIYAVILNIATVGFRFAYEGNPNVVIPVALTSLAVGIAGQLRLASGFGYSRWKTSLFVFLVSVPVMGFLTLAKVNEKATKALRAGGYDVGFFGARGRPAA